MGVNFCRIIINCIFMVTSEAELLFIYLLTFTVSTSANYIFLSCDHFSIRLCAGFFSYCRKYLYILDINPLLVINAASIYNKVLKLYFSAFCCTWISNLKVVNLLIFLSLPCAFIVIRKPCTPQGQRGILHIFF